MRKKLSQDIKNRDDIHFKEVMKNATARFKERLKDIASKYGAPAQFVMYADTFMLAQIAKFYKDQILAKPIPEAHAKNNGESSYHYGTFRSPWNINKTGALELQLECEKWQEDSERLLGRTKHTAHLARFLQLIYLFVLPAGIISMFVLLACEQPRGMSKETWVKKFESLDAVPLYIVTGIFFVWAIAKLFLLGNVCGKHCKEILEMYELLSDSNTSLKELIKTLQDFKPREEKPQGVTIISLE